jgi:rhodanese-related sulfurtransferase
VSFASFVRENWIPTLTLLLSGAMLVWPLVQRRLGAMKDVDAAEVTLLINRRNAVLLDVRETAELEGGKLPNAVHIPLSQLDSRVQEIAKLSARPIVAYCASGRRTRAAGSALARAGFKDIYGLRGGIAAWKKEQLPLEK